MMAETVTQTETFGPWVFPTELSPEAGKLGLDVLQALWTRIETWCSVRWSPREVVWVVEGEGDWTPPLAPVTAMTAEVWEAGAWVDVTLPAGPYGYCLPGDGPYRVTATVGAGDTPEEVAEAFRRLIEYSAAVGKYGLLDGRAGTTEFRGQVGEIEASGTRTATWAARAIINSGAADLLRPYRRAA